jgi:PAS domain S-box-containing protein
MEYFFQPRMDVIYFAYGLTLTLLAPICLLLKRKNEGQLAWGWLGLFGIISGLSQWLELVNQVLLSSFYDNIIQLGLLALSFLFLLEFGRSSLKLMGYRTPGRWVLLALLGLASLGGLAGMPGLFTSVKYVLGFTSSLWAGWALYLSAQKTRPPTKALVGVALGFGLYALAAGLVVNPVPYFPASLLNQDSFKAAMGIPIQLVRLCLALWVLFSLWSFSRLSISSVSDRLTQIWERRLILAGMIGFLVIVSLGAVVTEFFGIDATKKLRDKSAHEAQIIEFTIINSQDDALRFAQLMSSSQNVINFLREENSLSLQYANAVLDRYSQALPDTVCYLLDLGGVTLASSNRDKPDSFVGKSFGFRPYFKQALIGYPGRYWALGTTSNVLGFYGSYPVIHSNEGILGVVVIKKPVQEIKNIFPKDSITLVTDDSHGIILLASRPDLLFKSVSPLTPKATAELLETRQFGTGPYLPILAEPPKDGSQCLYRNKPMQVLSRSNPDMGFSIVILSPSTPIVLARLAGCGLSLVCALGFISVLMILGVFLDSASQISASENLHRTLLEGSPHCTCLLDLSGRFLVINAPGLESFGFKKEELLMHRFTDIWPEESRLQVEEALQHGLKGKQTAFKAQYNRPNGQGITLQMAINPIQEKNGELNGLVAIATDITAHQQAEAALRESESRFRTLFDHMSDCVAVYEAKAGGQDFIFKDINEAAEHQEKISKEKVAGRSVLEVFPVVTEFGLFKVFQKVWETGIPEHHSGGFRTQSGAMEWKENYVYKLPSGEIVAIYQDVTERKQTEKELRDHAYLLETLINTIPSPIFYKNVQGIYLGCNKALCDFLGLPKEEIVGKSVHEIYPQEQADKYFAMDMALLRQPGVQLYDSSMPHADGSMRDIHFLKGTYSTADGPSAGVVGVMIDITDRKQAESAILQAKREWERTFNAIPDLICLIDRNHRILRVNQAMAQALGCTPKEAVGLTCYQAVHGLEDPPPFCPHQQMLRDGQHHMAEVSEPKLGGHYEVSVSPLYDATGQVTGGVHVARDVTALAEKARELARSNEELEAFAYVASHDLQEPLRMIKGYLTLLARRYQGKLDTDADEFIGFAVDGATRMQRLITDLLVYSRVGSRHKTPEPTNCNNILEQAQANLKAMIDESEAVIDYDSLPIVLADSTQLIQLFQNLLGNALKFRRDLPPHIHVGAERDNGFWRFTVKDNGLGIEPEFFPRIFQVFKRLHRAVEYPGTGIGLAVCKKIVERHGGRIWVDSIPGSGSAFHFTFPVVEEISNENQVTPDI